MSWEIISENGVRFREKTSDCDVNMAIFLKRGDLGKKYLHKADITIWENGKEIVGSSIYNLKMLPHNIEICNFWRTGEESRQVTLKSLKKYLKVEYDIDLKEYEKKAMDVMKGWCG